jgi:carboxypeptidase T
MTGEIMHIVSGKVRWIHVLLVLVVFSGGFSSALGRDLSSAVLPVGQPFADYVVARVNYQTRTNLEQLAVFLDIWEVNQAQGYLVALLSPSNYALLEQSGYALIIDQAQTALLKQQLEALPGQSPDTIPGYPCYRTVEETYATITSLAEDYPQLAELIDIGDSWEKVTPDSPIGYDIYALRLTNEEFGNLDVKPIFFLMAEIHAREYVTAETATRFAEYLLSNYHHDADITWLLDHYRVYILTMTNPDGRKHAENGYYWRKNTNITNGCINDWSGGTDLNRNHSFHWGGASNDPCAETYQGPEPASEPETQVLQNFILSIFTDQRGAEDTDIAPTDTTGLLISLHSHGQLVLWPWGWTATDAPNHLELQTLGRRLAYFNDYLPQQGYELYPTTGTSDDWAYGELGIAAYTFEMGTTFFQDCASFESTIYPDNLEALLYAFKAARLPYMDPSGPRVINLTITPDIADPGTPATLAAVADDALFSSNNGKEPTQSIKDAHYSIDTPSWVSGVVTYPISASDGKFNSDHEAMQAIIDTTTLTAGPHIIFVEAMDADGNWGVPSAIYLSITGLSTTFLPMLYKK